MSILIVDDSEDSRLLLEKYLQEKEYACTTVESGGVALDVLANEVVELALIDVMMPGMTGFSLFQRIKEDYPDEGVVFVTSVDDLNIAVDHLKNGAYDYIVKPVTRARVQHVVEEALEKMRTVAEEIQRRSLLERRVNGQAKDLESKVRELSSLNRLFQAELSDRFATEELEPRIGSGSTGDQRRWRMMSGQEAGTKGELQCRETVSGHPERASAVMEEIAADHGTVGEDGIRRASHGLYASVVGLGLGPALRSLADRLRPLLLVEVSIQEEIKWAEESDPGLFSEEFKVGVYRIAEEALGNAVKHAQARFARVVLERKGPGSILIDITDDGPGFGAEKISSVFGYCP